MKDIQSQADHRRINIKKVGVKDISYPITVLDKAKLVQHTVAMVNMYVSLPHRFKGTHMSRFIEILNRFHGKIGLKSFRPLLEEMKRKLEAQAAHVELQFPYFLKKARGRANAIGMAEYRCRMHGSLDDEEEELTLEVQVPITPLLPAQDTEGLPRSPGRWGVANVQLRFRHFIWIEDLIQMVEEVISHKRWAISPVTPEESSLSVESVTSALGERLASHPDIRRFTVTVENLAEGYSTFASLEWPYNEDESADELVSALPCRSTAGLN
ncbi:MAG: hypothetical protein A2521_11440 [Deltaproteobacteria bacterium RIFOXYD12_FULL_57_12]|nr:MAG: hypothetical protein A2521_11440 [Deltaproteobacteria bacterium RIFOXYD12_FULL_57_12]